jgi:hypothetical protein
MPGSSSWMPYAPQGVKELDDDDHKILQNTVHICIQYPNYN